jgi:capsular exopolysaccharide synthesis family protein
VVLALIVAFILGLGAVALAETADRRIRDPEEVGELAGLPLLSAIPESGFSLSSKTRLATEAFVTLRSSLTYFNIDHGLSSVLITSPGKEDGKSTVSAELGRALARAGQDVILLDADLRRPTIAHRLGIPAKAGLGQVLLGQISVEEALWAEDLGDNGGKGKLFVLPAGPPAPNPSELLGSRRMLELLPQLTGRCGILLIDSTPLLTVSDSMPLLRSVSGVVIVARVNQTSRAAIARLRSVIDSAGGKALGAVATGARTGGLYIEPGYGYRHSYAKVEGADQNGSAPGRRRRLGRLRDAIEREKAGARNAE